MKQRDLATIATEIGGISDALHILCAALDPNSEFDAAPTRAAFSMSLFAIAQHLERIQDDLDAAHLVEVKG